MAKCLRICFYISLWAGHFAVASASLAQTNDETPGSREIRIGEFRDHQFSTRLESFSLPIESAANPLLQSTDSETEEWLNPVQSNETLTNLSNVEPEVGRLQYLSNIPISLGTRWLTDAQAGMTTTNASFKFPILGLADTPPPIAKVGFAFTNLSPGPGMGLPSELFEYSVGLSKVFRIREKWTVRTMLGIALATDNRNQSGDAWQFRGGIFGVYKASPQWQWTLGAIALGRDDLPVVPALGAVWSPSPSLRWDLIPPNPRLNILLSKDASRENWLYFGGGFAGTTWGYRTIGNSNDQLTYSDLRVVTGCLIQPPTEPGVPFARGRKYNLELGYNFSRDLEFNNELVKIPLKDAWMFRLETRY